MTSTGALTVIAERIDLGTYEHGCRCCPHDAPTQEELARIEGRFRSDIEDAAGTTTHPRRDAYWSIAQHWGRADGPGGILREYREIPDAPPEPVCDES